jgi:hypothetical protein
MVCLFHGDYGPVDPAFISGSASRSVADASLLKSARNIGEVEAIQRLLLKGETVSWCDQGYAWVEQDAVGWFYGAAFMFVILPYLIMKIRAWTRGASWLGVGPKRLDGRPQLPPLSPFLFGRSTPCVRFGRQRSRW